MVVAKSLVLLKTAVRRVPDQLPRFAASLVTAGLSVATGAALASGAGIPPLQRTPTASEPARRSGPSDDAPTLRATDLLQLRAVTAIAVSRDGRRAVYVVRSIAPAQWQGDDAVYEYRATLWTIDLVEDAAEPRQLTFGPAMDSFPTISPDGREVAFLRRGQPGANPGEARPETLDQVFVLPLDGGEAQALTAMPHGAKRPAWSADGRQLVFAAPVELAELPGAPAWDLGRPGRRWNDEPFTGTADAPKPAGTSPDGDLDQRRAWLAKNASQRAPLVISRLDFVEDTALRRSTRFDQLFVVDRHGLDPAPRRITGAFADHQDPAFMPDGRSIIYSRIDPRGAHPDTVRDRELRVVPTSGGDERIFLGREGFAFERPEPSPSGTHVGFLATRTDEPASRPAVLGVVPIDRGNPPASAGRAESAEPGDATGGTGPDEPVFITEALDRSVVRWQWNASSTGFLFVVADRGGFPLLSITSSLVVPVDVARRHDGFPVGVHAVAAGAGAVVYARTTPQQPSVLVCADARGERELVDLNPWTAQRRLSIPIERWIERPDGERIQSFVMPPPRLVPGRRAPVALMIHGGPAAMWGPGELSSWHELQYLASRGFGVVYANPRGSIGYGADFVRANRGDWGPGPAGDVLAALDDALRFDWADRERQVIGGGSYGAYLTAFVIGRERRFRAAVADRGVYDLRTFFGEGSAWRLVEWTYGGMPFDQRLRDRIDRDSPVNDVQRIRTPLLIMHGDIDRRTGTAQSEMLYRGLRVLGRPVELVRYPNADHDLSRRGDIRLRLDRLVRTVEFFERFTGG